MLLIPAIDLKDGKCVRLQQGDMNVATTFGDDPAAMARRWLDAGARRLHLVDLNGAFAGKPVNESAVKSILAEIDGAIPVQLGGGLRDLDTIERYLDDGLRHVLCTDVARDGALTGPNVALYAECVHRFPNITWQASGGVSVAADLHALAATGATAVISGRALLEGRLNAEELVPFLPAA